MTEIWPGRPFLLGAQWDGEGTNFSLFSEKSEKLVPSPSHVGPSGKGRPGQISVT